jgi:23S rRNA pseudouridine2605 synthase
MRLDKFLVSTGKISRSDAGRAARGGKITVNGVVEKHADRHIDPDTDIITLQGERIVYRRYTYILLNKPRGIVTTLSDEKNRPTVLSLICDLGVRVYPVGRLDYNSDGLLLLTDDGELTNKLTHPKHHIPKIYHVTVKGEVSEAQLKKLSSALVIDGYKIQPVEVEIIKKEPSQATLKMTLYEGRNRQIRKMCALCKLPLKSLTRVALGKITLGNLPLGKWRYLTPDEISYLKSESANK